MTETTVAEAAHSHPPDLESVELLTVLQALADPVRLEIVRQLAACPDPGELMCGQLQIPVTKSTGSHHLRTLLRAGVTTEREAGTCKYVGLRRAELARRFPGLLESVLRAADPVF